MDEEVKIADIQYECINEFSVELYDGDGFPTNEYKSIPVGSIWCKDADTNIIGGEVHLDCFETLDWIEIPKDRLTACFNELE